MTAPARASNSPTSSIAAQYRASAGADMMLGRSGEIEPAWVPVLEELDRLTHGERLERIDRINAHVREIGIAHDLFADPTANAQPWRLDLMPLILSEDTWRQIERGVAQRGRLVEALLGDLYGGQAVLRRGIVPAALVFSDPSYLRVAHGIGAGSGRLQFFAVDLALGLDGVWRVVDTHCETPAGIGYALANRSVMTHAASAAFSASRIVRLAAFFEQMQDALAARTNRPDPSIALLTPGPRHADFFSHAYLARYLGLLLVEGGDLRVDRGRMFLKTLDGLRPVDLVIRAIAGAEADPLELDPVGFLGPVGLVAAARQTPNLVANALGSALAENRGLGPYLPVLARELLGEDLLLADTPKLWLGDRTNRERVLAGIERYFIRHASEQTARPGQAAAARDPAVLPAAERARLAEEFELTGMGLVAEEKAELATAPAYGAQGLEPRAFVMRVFASASPGGFAVMPGGLAMSVDPARSLALTVPDGAARDVWVTSTAPQPAFRSLWRPTIEAAHVQRTPRELPSRAADNLFWLGRNVERCDWTLRLLRACYSRLEIDGSQRQDMRLLRRALSSLVERDADEAPVAIPAGALEADAVALLARSLLASPDRDFGLLTTLDHVHRIASLTRDRLSLEAWRTLNAFHAGRRWHPSQLPTGTSDLLDLIDQGLGFVAAFNGLTHENMTRNLGWSFLDMGRRLSRAEDMAHLLNRVFATDQAESEGAPLRFVLELADSFITYRSRYRLTPLLPLVLDLLIVDETNPRSIAYQLAELGRHIDSLPQTGKGRGRTEVQRIALALLTDVRLADVAALAATGPAAAPHRAGLGGLLAREIDGIDRLSDAITRRYFTVVEKEQAWVRARSR